MTTKNELPLSELAYREIKQRILRLEFRPDQFLTESAICGLLGIGRTPIHQAIHRLKDERLLDVIPRKGLIIRPDSMNEILNILEAREAVEPNIAALAAEKATTEHIDGMQKILNEMDNSTDERYRMLYMQVDYDFHGMIAEAAANPILTDVIRPLHERSRRLWYLQLHRSNDLEQTQVEHEAIYNAVKRRDKAAAAQAMQAHLTSLRRRRISVFHDRTW